MSVIQTTWAPLHPLVEELNDYFNSSYSIASVVNNAIPRRSETPMKFRSREFHSVYPLPSQILREERVMDERYDAYDLRVTRNTRKYIIWTEPLHEKFLDALSILGSDATPARILKEMNIPGLTRENVSSHLQKFRKKLKHSYNMESLTSFCSNQFPSHLM